MQKELQYKMKYEWDAAKNLSNFAKLGLAFEDAEIDHSDIPSVHS